MAKIIYEFDIHRMDEDTPAYKMGNPYGFHYAKAVGSHLGGAAPIKDRADLEKHIGWALDSWSRESNVNVKPPSKKNMQVLIHPSIDIITEREVWTIVLTHGKRTLDSFFKPE